MRLMMVGTGQQQIERQDSSSRYGAARQSRFGLGGTVAVHALVIGLFLLIPKDVIDTFRPGPPITTYDVPDDPPPPPEPSDQVRTDPKLPTQPQPQRPTAPEPRVPLPSGETSLTGGTSSGDAADPVPPYVPPLPPMAEPVLTGPEIDPRALSAFQPDYPGAMIRQGLEGKVTVRVTISAEGRVTDIEKISATDDSFWAATQRHALRKWRFRPATRDGVAVASSKVLTVRFTLTER